MCVYMHKLNSPFSLKKLSWYKFRLISLPQIIFVDVIKIIYLLQVQKNMQTLTRGERCKSNFLAEPLVRRNTK